MIIKNQLSNKTKKSSCNDTVFSANHSTIPQSNLTLRTTWFTNISLLIPILMYTMHVVSTPLKTNVLTIHTDSDTYLTAPAPVIQVKKEDIAWFEKNLPTLPLLIEQNEYGSQCINLRGIDHGISYPDGLDPQSRGPVYSNFATLVDMIKNDTIFPTLRDQHKKTLAQTILPLASYLQAPETIITQLREALDIDAECYKLYHRLNIAHPEKARYFFISQLDQPTIDKLLSICNTIGAPQDLINALQNYPYSVEPCPINFECWGFSQEDAQLLEKIFENSHTIDTLDRLEAEHMLDCACLMKGQEHNPRTDKEFDRLIVILQMHVNKLIPDHNDAAVADQSHEHLPEQTNEIIQLLTIACPTSSQKDILTYLFLNDHPENIPIRLNNTDETKKIMDITRAAMNEPLENELNDHLLNLYSQYSHQSPEPQYLDDMHSGNGGIIPAESTDTPSGATCITRTLYGIPHTTALKTAVQMAQNGLRVLLPTIYTNPSSPDTTQFADEQDASRPEVD